MALETSTWLNQCFMEKVLRKSEGDNSIQVIDIFAKPATNKGDNYTSDMVRVNVEFSRNQGGRKITEKKSVIVKLAPLIEGTRRELVLKARLFDTEITMMSDTLEKMNKLLMPGDPLSAKGLYIQKEDPILLVIEDLAPLGFRMADRQSGLNLDHCLLALRGLARFHAASVALCEKEPNQKQMYKRGMFNSEHPEEMGAFFIHGTKALAAEMKNWPEIDKKYADKVDKLADHVYRIGIKVNEMSENEFNVINHGDFWVNNMLFKYNEQGKPVGHICVDFQICNYATPAIDLNYFLSTSPSQETIENSKDVLLDKYLSTLSTTMKQLGCKTQPPTMEQLRKSLRERAAYGMLAAFTVLPVVVCEKSDLKDLDEMLGKDGKYDNPSYRGKTYRKLMLKRIPMYDELGLLDL